MFGGNKNPDIQERAEHITADAADNLREMGRSARERADDVKHEAVKLLNNAADTIRKEARRAGANKDVRGGADDIARSLEQAAHYLKRHSYEDMGEDMTRTVQRNPWRAMAVIFVVGLMIGLMLRSDGDKRRASTNGYDSYNRY